MRRTRMTVWTLKKTLLSRHSTVLTPRSSRVSDSSRSLRVWLIIRRSRNRYCPLRSSFSVNTKLLVPETVMMGFSACRTTMTELLSGTLSLRPSKHLQGHQIISLYLRFYQWLNAKLQFIQCFSNGDIAVLSEADFFFHITTGIPIMRFWHFMCLPSSL